MGNTWFRFRQFVVHQEKAAMKVTTDSCLFGALQPILPEEGKEKKILDIGAGTGLLSLMMAQLNPGATITAVEIEAGAAREASRNFAISPFSLRLNVIQENILNFKPEQPFDYIICNPPFHEAQLSSPDRGRNLAHHGADLKMDELLSITPGLLTGNGTLSLLLPFYREAEIQAMAAANGFYCQKMVRVRQTPKHDFFRSVLFLGRSDTHFQVNEMVIRDENNAYSPEFQSLLHPFYLNL